MTVNVSKPAINVREKLAELDKPTGIAGEAMLRAETPQEQFNLIGAGRRRINHNGSMRISQRGTSSTSNGYLIDRYKSYNATGATFTQSQGTTSPPEGFGHYLKINTDTADTSIGSSDYFQLSHIVEGQDVIGSGWGTSSAIPITLSFWVKSNVTGTYAVEIQTGSGSYESSHNYTVNASGVWEYKTVTFPAFTSTAIPMNNTAGFYLNWWLAAGSTWNTGTISPEWTTGNSGRASGQVNLFAAQNNYWQVTGVQLELGKVATPFEHRSYGEELALCQRYYIQYELASYQRLAATSYCDINNRTQVDISLPVPLRSYVSAGHTNLTISGQAVNGINLTQTGSNSNILTGNLTCPGTPLTVGTIYQIYAIGAGNFYVNGEL